MNKTEIMEKIHNVKNLSVEYEVFDKLRPQEEFGDAVELFYNDQENVFRAVVFDPETKKVYHEMNFPDVESTYTFISGIVEDKVRGKVSNMEIEPINLD